jgi:hypothetical protein
MMIALFCFAVPKVLLLVTTVRTKPGRSWIMLATRGTELSFTRILLIGISMELILAAYTKLGL